jgi:two-component system, OmpR family, sensor kinase
MAYDSQSASVWQRLRHVPERLPLRTKLITAVLSLVAVALAIISIAGIGFIHNYLIGQANSEIGSLVNAPRPQSLDTVVTEFLNGARPGQSQGLSVDWVSGGKVDQVIYPTAAVQYTAPAQIAGPEVTAQSNWLHSGQPVTVSASSGPGRWQVYSFPATVPANGQLASGYIVIGVDVTTAYTTIGKLTAIDLIVSLLVLLGLFVVGVAVVRASLRPLIEIEQTAGAIAAGDLTRRVPERDPRTEVGRLGRSLNTMLSQIEMAFRARSRSEAAARRSEEKMRQFVADASHELRTPLTAIRGFAEYYRQRGGIADAPVADDPIPQVVLDEAAAIVGRNGQGKLSSADLDRIMRRVEQESARMGVLVEDMLLLARMDQQRPLDHGTVDLLTLAADAVHDARVVAPGRSINLTVGAGAALLVNGDEVRLRQVIGNLMSNALAHTPAGTPIDVRIRSGSLAEAMPTGTASDSVFAVGANATNSRSQAAAVLEVSDHGPGLTREQAEHAFERFYRADQARTAGGTGLGLAIVAALVAAHGGAVWVRSQPGEGATFAIALPLTPEATAGAEDEAAEPDDEAEFYEDAEFDADDQVDFDDPAWHDAA